MWRDNAEQTPLNAAESRGGKRTEFSISLLQNYRKATSILNSPQFFKKLMLFAKNSIKKFVF